MVEVWVAEITPLLEEKVYEEYYCRLPGWRREKADRLARREDRARSVGAWSLWESVKQKAGLTEQAVFNLSHSGKYVLCAYSDKEGVRVGCDLEMVKEMRMKIARRFFCEEEYLHIESMKNEEEKRQMFYRYWVLKESFMKAVRKGMALDTRSYAFGWKEGIPQLIRRPSEYQEKYYLKEYSIAEGEARAAVCTTDESGNGELHLWSFAQE